MVAMFDSPESWIVVAAIAVFLFGSAKLPELARSLGQVTIRVREGTARGRRRGPAGRRRHRVDSRDVPSDAPPITIRPFTAEEIPTCSRIFYEAFNDLHARRGLPTEDPADDAWIRTALTRGRRTDPELALLALDDDGPAAFGTAARRNDFWFLSFLFVLPRAQGRGIGRALLEALLPPAAERGGRAAGHDGRDDPAGLDRRCTRPSAWPRGRRSSPSKGCRTRRACRRCRPDSERHR